MVKYTIAFVGRTKSAIGVFYPITADRTAPTEGAAVLALYDEYEHIQQPYIVAEDGQRVPARKVER